MGVIGGRQGTGCDDNEEEWVDSQCCGTLAVVAAPTVQWGGTHNTVITQTLMLQWPLQVISKVSKFTGGVPLFT